MILPDNLKDYIINYLFISSSEEERLLENKATECGIDYVDLKVHLKSIKNLIDSILKDKTIDEVELKVLKNKVLDIGLDFDELYIYLTAQIDNPQAPEIQVPLPVETVNSLIQPNSDYETKVEKSHAGSAFMRATKKILGVSLLIVLLILGGTFALKYLLGGSYFAKQPDLVSIIQRVGTLNTVQTELSCIVDKTNINSPGFLGAWSRLLGDKTIIIPVSAVLKVGINVRDISANDISVDRTNKTVVISLPNPSFELESTKVHGEKIIDITSWAHSDYNTSEMEELLQLSRSVLEEKAYELSAELITTAQENAKQVFQALLAPWGYQVDIICKQSADFSKEEVMALFH